MSYMLGGEVSSCDVSEYGPTKAKLKISSVLFEGMKATQNVLMSHTDFVSKVPKGFKVIAKTDNCPCGAIENPEMKLYGVQFHPEVEHTENGTRLIHNFLLPYYEELHTQRNKPLMFFIHLTPPKSCLTLVQGCN